MENSPTPGFSTVYSMPFGSVVNPTPLTSFSNSINNLAVDNDGWLVATKFGPAPSLMRIHSATGAVTFVNGAPPHLNALVIERCTGDYIVASRDTAVFPYLWRIWRVPAAGGTATLLSSGPPGGMGVLSGLDLNPDPEIYGAPSASAFNDSNWFLTPNPGGLPRVGNTNFSLSIASRPGGVPGLFAIALAPLPAPLSVAGIVLHVDLSRLLLLGSLSGLPFETIPLPLPPEPVLMGIEAFFQAAHAIGSSFTDATGGLSVTIL
jgi:hypothetical protein